MSRKQKDAAVAQSVVRRIGSAEVTGPIPVSSSARKERKPLNCKDFRFFTFPTCNSFQLCYNDNSLDGDIAQLGERCVRNAKVAGSNPVVSIEWIVFEASDTILFYVHVSTLHISTPRLHCASPHGAAR